MSPSQSRFGRRHLLALCTFLIPLAVLAALGWNELQRSGARVQAALEREGRQFLHSAAQAIEQQLTLRLPVLAAACQQELAEQGPVRTALRLRDRPDTSDLLDVVLLDEQFALVWPTPPPGSIGLPFDRDARARGTDGTVASALQAVDLLLARSDLAGARSLLQHLVAQIGTTERAARGSRRSELEEAEPPLRFRLGTVLNKLGEHDAAREQFERVVRSMSVGQRPGRIDVDNWSLSLLAECALAELGSAADRTKLLRSIAESRRDLLADGLLSAVARRLAAGVPADDALRVDVDELLAENRQRTQSRTFAAAYDLVLKFGLRLRHLRSATPDDGDDDAQELMSTLFDRTTLVLVRRATAAERERFRCARVGLHVDLDRLLAPTLAPFTGPGSSFVLAVDDPDGVSMLTPPGNVPESFSAPVLECRGLQLRAFPANPARLVADTNAAARNRTLLMVALFAAAFAGALWLWRSASREAEAASLKVDFVSRVSHELKTPLALIRMYGETLGMGRARDPQQAAQFGDVIARESERLTTLIQRILDFSRQQAGTLTYAPQRVDLGELLRTVCDAYTPHLEARGAILVETLPGGLVVECDRSACESAVVNLLENAAKYGIEGDDEHEIELELSATRDEVTIEVRDRGRGIPAGELERVFESFYRAGNAGEVRGAGLGLSLVRHFARCHGGDVVATPRPGGGTILRLRLPRAPSRPTIRDPETTDPS